MQLQCMPWHKHGQSQETLGVPSTRHACSIIHILCTTLFDCSGSTWLMHMSAQFVWKFASTRLWAHAIISFVKPVLRIGYPAAPTALHAVAL